MTNSNKQNELSNGQSRDAWYLLFSCWLTASVATLGSLFLDTVLGMEPCLLCWYQRIFMYPLALILLTGLLLSDRRVAWYGLPVAFFGWMTAFYHLLMVVGIVPESLQPCGSGPSCVQDDLDLFGFVSIPLLSLLSFSVVIGLLLIFMQRTKM